MLLLSQLSSQHKRYILESRTGLILTTRIRAKLLHPRYLALGWQAAGVTLMTAYKDDMDMKLLHRCLHIWVLG